MLEICKNSVLANIAQLKKARHVHKIIQSELTRDKRVRLHENNNAMQGIIIWRINFIRLIHVFLHPYQVPAVCISSDAIIT